MNQLLATPWLDWFELEFDRSLDVDDVRQLLVSVVSVRRMGLVGLEAQMTGGVVRYRIGAEHSCHLVRSIRSFLPSVVMAPVKREPGDKGTAWSIRSNTKRRSLRFDDPQAATRRLLGLLALEGAVYQLVIGRRLRPVAVPSRLEGLRSESWVGAAFEAAWAGSRRVDGELRRSVADKQSEPGAEANVRLLVPGPSERARVVAPEFAAFARSLESPGLRLRLVKERWRNGRSASIGWRSIPLNVDELVAVSGWPHGEDSYVGLDRSGSRVVQAPAKSGSRIVGFGVHPASRVDVGISPTDGLRHTWSLGPTGVGKSTVLGHMALQDIEAGRGVVVIDPKGDLVDGLLARVQDRDLSRVVLLDPGRRDQVVGFNPLAVEANEVELAADGVLHVVRSLNSESWGPRTQDVLHASLLTLAFSDRPTLMAVPQILSDERFRRGATKDVPIPALSAFWAWYESLSGPERSAVIAPVLNKIRPFTMRSGLRTMLGQFSPSFKMESIFSDRKILLVPLRKGLVGPESANLLGSLLVASLWQTALKRSGVQTTHRHPVFAYLDEFQDYLRLPTEFADVLAQSRGLGLGLVLAHQHLGQLSPNVKAAVMANAHTKLMFRLGADDAQVIARQGSALDAVDFTSLKPFSAYLDLLNEGDQTGWVSIKTLPPRPALRHPEALALELAQLHGVRPSVVDDALYGRSRPDNPDESIGVKLRGPRRDAI